MREQARFWLRDFQRRLGITTIYVTHDQAEALAISDMVAVMSNGKLLQYAPPLDVYEKPTSKFVADFIGVSSFLNGTIIERAQNKTHVKIETGETLTSARPAPAGDKVTIAIRSERIRLVPASDQSPNTIPAKVASGVYLGSKWQYLVELKSGTMRVETMDAAPGEHIRLAFAPEDLILLANEQ